MTDSPLMSPARIRRRQYLLLGGLAALIGGAALVSVSLTRTERHDAASKPKSTHILTPGAQVDPRDAWRGQADAQLKSIEQKSREIGQRNAELEAQNKAMLERLRKLEEPRLTPLPPPPVPAPPVRPSFGPDRAAPGPMEPAAVQQLPPPPVSRPMTNGPATAPGSSNLASQPGIVSIVLAEPSSAKRTTRMDTPATTRDTRRYLPSGTFAQAVLLGGLDAPTGGQAQRNPQPVLLRISDHAVLPNHFRSRVKACFVVGAGYGDVSAERAYIRTESLSCVTRDGQAIDVPIKGYIAGEDGKAGMRGRLVSKQGQILANALLAGIAGGIGSAFQQQSTTFSVSPLGSTSTTDPGRQLETGLGSGVGKALDRLAGYYITLAEKTFPVVEIDAGRTVDVILTQGIALQGDLDRADAHELARPTHRTTRPRKDDDDE